MSSVPEWLMTSVPCSSLALFSVVPLKWRNDLKYLKLEAITHWLNVWEDELSGCDSIHTFPVLRIATQPCAFAVDGTYEIDGNDCYTSSNSHVAVVSLNGNGYRMLMTLFINNNVLYLLRVLPHLHLFSCAVYSIQNRPLFYHIL